MTEQGLSNEEIAKRLERLRRINREHAEGEISWEERVRRHQEVVPDIGEMMVDPGRPSGPRKCRC
jgi:hypothetical protein